MTKQKAPAVAASTFLTSSEIEERIASRNVVLSASSTLIARDVEVGKNNTFYTGVVIETRGAGVIAIGDGNVFWPGTVLLAFDGGRVTIGDGNEIGPGGCQVKANVPESDIRIGNGARFNGAVEMLGRSLLGNGVQVLGTITVQNTTLAGGEDFRTTDPNQRGAVLKGFGLARNLVVGRGEVINGAGAFEQDAIERQIKYHPKAGSQ